ncbi:MAG: Holliday junction resolvase RuvX [Leptospiraceae bacterium]|nr:Holliday junction resolvase RuvX [Leptospiraceae bacterium]
MNDKRILSIDFGLKRIGLAVCDSSKIVITRLPQVENRLPELWHVLTSKIREYQNPEILLGYPFHERSDGKTEVNRFLVQLEKFKEKLLEKFPDCKLILWDESFTSELAKEHIFKTTGSAKSAKSRKKKKDNLDSTAAALLLKNYLQSAAE